MKYSTFEDRVVENASNFSREFLEERNVAMTIGTAWIAGAGLHVAIIRVKGITPYGAKRDLSTNWHLATAEDGPAGFTSSEINKSDVTINAVNSPQLTVLQIGRDPLLPDNALMTVSPAREFYPTILIPEAVTAQTEGIPYDDRYQIVVPDGGRAEI